MNASTRAAYARMWGRPYIEPETPTRDDSALEAAWARAAEDVVETAGSVWGEARGYIYHPYLRAFHATIRNSWQILSRPDVVTRLLLLIEKMHENPLAAVVAYEQLQASLELAGESTLVAVAASKQAEFMASNPDWAEVLSRLSHESVRNRAPDFTPESESPGLEERTETLFSDKSTRMADWVPT